MHSTCQDRSTEADRGRQRPTEARQLSTDRAPSESRQSPDRAPTEPDRARQTDSQGSYKRLARSCTLWTPRSETRIARSRSRYMSVLPWSRGALANSFLSDFLPRVTSARDRPPAGAVVAHRSRRWLIVLDYRYARAGSGLRPGSGTRIRKRLIRIRGPDLVVPGSGARKWWSCTLYPGFPGMRGSSWLIQSGHTCSDPAINDLGVTMIRHAALLEGRAPTGPTSPTRDTRRAVDRSRPGAAPA